MKTKFKQNNRVILFNFANVALLLSTILVSYAKKKRSWSTSKVISMLHGITSEVRINLDQNCGVIAQFFFPKKLQNLRIIYLLKWYPLSLNLLRSVNIYGERYQRKDNLWYVNMGEILRSFVTDRHTLCCSYLYEILKLTEKGFNEKI